MEELNPQTLEQALALLACAPHTVVGGGTDLMVRHRAWAGLPADLSEPPLFTSGIAALREIRVEGDTLRVGGAVTLAELLAHPAAPACLKEALHGMAAPGIRNVATLAGNLCNASPAGDSLPVLYALNASVALQSEAGARTLPVAEFIRGPGKKDLRADELLTGVAIPLAPFDVSVYRKVGPRRAQAISKLSFVGLARLRGGRVSELRAAFGAVGPTVVRRPEIERTLAGMGAAALLQERAHILEAYAPFITPIDDQRSTAAYRKETALGLLGHFLEQLAARAGEERA